MTPRTIEADGIGPQLDLANLRLPPHVGEHLATLLDSEGRLETGADWIDALRTASRQIDGDLPTEADLCHLADGNHTVEIDGETHSFVCVLDPLAVPFLRGRPGTVRSVTPVDEATITVEIDESGASVDTDGAVVSLGVSRDPATEGPLTHEDIYGECCPYIHVFASVAEYERWTDGVDAATTSVPVETGVAVARELALGLFAESDEEA